jgi:lysophospholipase L1-like esterase
MIDQRGALVPRSLQRVRKITEFWAIRDPEFFARADFVDRGISGQTTPQMLLRFREDVIALKPAVVHILAGTNDIAGNTGPMDLPAIEANIASMVDLARVNGIQVVIGSVLPAAEFPWRPGLDPARGAAPAESSALRGSRGALLDSPHCRANLRTLRREG